MLIVGSNPRTRGAGAQRPHPQALARRQLPDRPASARPCDLTYDYDYLGAGRRRWRRSPKASTASPRRCKSAKQPLIIVGAGRSRRAPTARRSWRSRCSAAKAVGAIAEGWNGFNVLHTAASRVGGLDLGFVPGEGGLDAPQHGRGKGALDVLFLLGADEIDVAPRRLRRLHRHPRRRGAHRADVILPGAAYTEKSATYVNTEGRPQIADRAGFPPGEAREDWAILRALSEPSRPASCPSTRCGQLRAQLYAELPAASRGSTMSMPADPAGLDPSRRRGRDHARRSARRSRTST